MNFHINESQFALKIVNIQCESDQKGDQKKGNEQYKENFFELIHRSFFIQSVKVLVMQLSQTNVRGAEENAVCCAKVYNQRAQRKKPLCPLVVPPVKTKAGGTVQNKTITTRLFVIGNKGRWNARLII